MDDTINQLEMGKERWKDSGWFRRKWKPIKKHTWNFYTSKYYELKRLGVTASYNRRSGCWDIDGNYHNKCFRFSLDLIWIEINFWIKWDFIAIIHDKLSKAKEV